MPSSSCAVAASATKAKSQPQRLSRDAFFLGAVKAGEELVALLARGGEVVRLHVAEAADVLGDRGDLHGERMVGRRELGQQALHVGFVLGDERTLGAPLDRVAEGVERGAAQ